MKSIGLVIATAFLTYTLTDIDDLCLLIIFFARARIPSDQMCVSNVILGQTLGFSVLVAISLIGIVLGAFLPASYVSLIGFVPILMGLRMAWEEYKDSCCNRNAPVATDEEKPDIEPAANEIILCNDNADIGIALTQKPPAEPGESPAASHEEETIANDSLLARGARAVLKNCLSPQTLEVCTITIANGGDNVSVYLPLFASYSAGGIIITIAVFYGMLVVWIALTYCFTNSKIISDFLSTYGEKVVPFFLIGLGVCTSYQTPYYLRCKM
jgi:cadmium resistance protein CadD (predicted permease)